VEQEILLIVASLVAHCCAIKKNVIVASQLAYTTLLMCTSQWSGLSTRVARCCQIWQILP